MNTEQYKKRGADLVGFWSPDLGPIHCKPLGAKLFDSNLDESKPSTLLICELVESCSAVTTKDDDEAELVPTNAGDLVGVWFKPGMAAIKTLRNEPCIIEYEREQNGDIKTKKMKKKGMNPMKCFSVSSAKNPMRNIPVIEDARVNSAHHRTMLAEPKNTPRTSIKPDDQPSLPVGPEDLDDVPF